MAKIEIDSDLTLKIYLDDSSDVPSLLQPHKPDGSSWKTKAEVQAWAKAFMLDYDKKVKEAQDAELAPVEVAPESIEG
jgi:hypothetical protein